MTTTKQNLETLNRVLAEYDRYVHASLIISFDRSTICPKNASEEEDMTINFLQTNAYRILKSEEYIKAVKELYETEDELDPLDKRLVSLLYKDIVNDEKISPEKFSAIRKVFTDAYAVWLKAKEESNYSLFAPALEAVIKTKKEIVDLSVIKKDTYYDTMIDYYEEGFCTADYDKFFNTLRDRIVPLLKKIQMSKVEIRSDFLKREIPLAKQEAFSKYLLELIGFDLDSGTLSTTEHPFTSTLARHDNRITTHYYLDNFISNMYSIIHEAGHAIFGQNQNSVVFDHHLSDRMSMGMHESVSRFYENRIGRSKEFIHLIYPKLIEIFHDELSDITEDELYRAINMVSPSLIRTEADELTYTLHIIIRYELEKEFMSKDVDISTLNQRWNELYKEYLGIDVSSDKEGILQDVHWTDSFGYFPTYALGNAFNAMYVNTMKKDFDLLEAVKNGEFIKIRDWMTEHVFKEANYLPSKEWIKRVTGRDLDPLDFIEYLENKYQEIYQL